MQCYANSHILSKKVLRKIQYWNHEKLRKIQCWNKKDSGLGQKIFLKLVHVDHHVASMHVISCSMVNKMYFQISCNANDRNRFRMFLLLARRKLGAYINRYITSRVCCWIRVRYKTQIVRAFRIV